MWEQEWLRLANVEWERERENVSEWEREKINVDVKHCSQLYCKYLLAIFHKQKY